MILELTRISTNEDVGTFGVLKWKNDKAPFALSLEDPWLSNTTNISCIPAGPYECRPFDSPTHGPTFEVINVVGRTYILFHKGNTHINTKGCILIGEQYEFLGNIPAVLKSGKGFQEFKTRAPKDGFPLVIKWAN